MTRFGGAPTTDLLGNRGLPADREPLVPGEPLGSDTT
jgi:hypothetical protein